MSNHYIYHIYHEGISGQLDKGYIGYTSNFKRRYNSHFSKLKKHSHVNCILQSAFYKYDIKMKVIKIFDNENDALSYENDLRSKPLIGWNISIGGSNSPQKGMSHTNESKKKISKTHKGIKKSSQHKIKISKSNLGKRYEILTCPHCGIESSVGNAKRWHFDNCKIHYNGDRKLSKEHLANLKKGQDSLKIGIWHTPNGSFDSMRKAAEANGNCSTRTIKSRCVDSNENKIRQNTITLANLHSEWLGKTWKEIGYWFERS